MSVNVPQLGNPKPIILDLTTTASTPIYAGSSKLRGLLNSMLVCNDSGSAATFTLALTDNAGLTVKLFDLKSVDAHDTYELTGQEIPIPNDWSLAITATTANTLHVTAVIVEMAVTRA